HSLAWDGKLLGQIGLLLSCGLQLLFVLLLSFLQDLGGSNVVPRVDARQCLVICHVALEWRNGNEALLDRVVVGAAGRIRIEILFANPEIRLAARIDMLGNDRSRVLDALTRYAY